MRRRTLGGDMEITTKEIPHEIQVWNEDLDIDLQERIDLSQYLDELETKIKELKSQICDHEWEDSFSITMTSEPVDLPGGGKAVHKQIIPVRVCTKCFHLRQKNPDEVAEMQKQMTEGVILPGDPRGNLLTPP